MSISVDQVMRYKKLIIRQIRRRNFGVSEDIVEIQEDGLSIGTRRRHFHFRCTERKFKNKKTQTLQISQNSVSTQADLRWGTCSVKTETDSKSIEKPVARVAPLNQEWFIYDNEAIPFEL